MRYLLLAVMLFAAVPASAGGLLDLSGLAKLVAEKAKETRGASLISTDMKIAGALYLPVYKFHSKRTSPTGDLIVYAELGAGAQMREGGDYRPFVNVGWDFPALSRRIWRSQWRKDHISMTSLPPIFIGPYINVPTKKSAWVFGSEVGIMVAISLGGK